MNAFYPPPAEHQRQQRVAAIVRPIAWLLLAAFVLLLAFVVAPSALARTLSVDEIVVVDADTFDVGDTRYRLAGADAPELQSPRCDAERRLARIAKRHVDTLFRNAREIRFEPTGRVQEATERYRRREEARVWVDGADLAALLLTADLAREPNARGGWCNGL